MIGRVAMLGAVGLSWAAMLAHNLYELPLPVVAPENTGPLVVAAALGLGYAAWPRSKPVAAALLGWGLLNLVVGGILTVLPLPILPFSPEQSVTHYVAHAAYTLGQVPLVYLAWRALETPSRTGS